MSSINEDFHIVPGMENSGIFAKIEINKPTFDEWVIF
jgi:hypothetical protein